MRLIDERKKFHWKFWLVLNYIYRFCECKYRFKLSFLWRKLEFYTKVHKRCTCYSLNHETWDTFLWSNHNHIFALRTTQDIIIRFFHNMFFLISTRGYWKITMKFVWKCFQILASCLNMVFLELIFKKHLKVVIFKFPFF